ncbi:MAG TPA: LysM peptidoglycan-binding domain-containing protein [Pirellulales bacterium]|jgi:nucleoid-associated protein YgaU|nr:LysM peptidoglycan-binding domain-containing protein [Pirellulales bacterium]
MFVGKKLVVVLSVLAGGAGTAFFFRKDASRVGRQDASDESPFRSRIERRLAADAAWSNRPGGAQEPKQALRVPQAATVAIHESRDPAADHQATFRRTFNPVGALLEPIEDTPRESAETEPPDLFGGQTDAADRLVRHKIADGDTLSKLAATYLEGSDRYLEIFELNRDVLTSPDLLPIGRELRIPPRRDKPAGGGAAIEAPSSERQLEPPLRMVPVPGRQQ